MATPSYLHVLTDDAALDLAVSADINITHDDTVAYPRLFVNHSRTVSRIFAARRQHICEKIGFRTTHIAPVAVRTENGNGLAVGDHFREQLTPEIVRRLRRNKLKHTAAQDINPRVDLVTRDAVPRRLFKKSRDSAVRDGYNAVFCRCFRTCRDDRRVAIAVHLRLDGGKQ